jgi:hypothetical protein
MDWPYAAVAIAFFVFVMMMNEGTQKFLLQLTHPNPCTSQVPTKLMEP